jgi:hypothetical protein
MSYACDAATTDTGPSVRIGYTPISTASQTLAQRNAALGAAGVTKTLSRE